MRVLVVEDDVELGCMVREGLRLDGFDVQLEADGDAALTAAERLRPELMVLDLGLPRRDGIEVLVEMTERYRSTSVLVLTARARVEDRVECLERGADDVVLKPFSLGELRARLRALGRRRSEEHVLRFGDLEMDRAERRVTQSGHEVELTMTEFSLLESLMRRRGEKVCSRAELLREVWRDPVRMGTNIVEVYINYLRKKLARRAGGGTTRANRESVIRTVRGEGYVLGHTDGTSAASRWNEAQRALARIQITAEGCVANA